MQSELNPKPPCLTSAYFQQQNQIGQVCPRSKITSRNRGNLDRSSPSPGNWTKMAISFRVSASSHKWEAYRRRRFCRFSRRERRAYLGLYVRSEQRRKSAKAPSALRVGLKRFVCVVARSLRIAADTLLTRVLHPSPFKANGMPPTYETMH